MNKICNLSQCFASIVDFNTNISCRTIIALITILLLQCKWEEHCGCHKHVLIHLSLEKVAYLMTLAFAGCRIDLSKITHMCMPVVVLMYEPWNYKWLKRVEVRPLRRKRRRTPSALKAVVEIALPEWFNGEFFRARHFPSQAARFGKSELNLAKPNMGRDQVHTDATFRSAAVNLSPTSHPSDKALSSTPRGKLTSRLILKNM